MSLLQVIVLAVIQGLTEFLPVSSSAHLILPSALFGWPDQGLAFDVSIHMGTLMAVLTYFRRDLRLLFQAWCNHAFRGKSSPESRLAWLIILGTIPAGLGGLLFNDFVETNLRSILVIALATIVFGLLLGVADIYSRKTLSIDSLTWRHAIFIGVAQAVALIPGTSRSGITMTAALALGFDRISASKFSFLLSIPIIVLSGGYESIQLVNSPDAPWVSILLAVLLSAATAYACIHVFLGWVSRLGMMPFVYYRIVLGAVLLALLWADLV